MPIGNDIDLPLPLMRMNASLRDDSQTMNQGQFLHRLVEYIPSDNLNVSFELAARNIRDERSQTVTRSFTGALTVMNTQAVNEMPSDSDEDIWIPVNMSLLPDIDSLDSIRMFGSIPMDVKLFMLKDKLSEHAIDIPVIRTKFPEYNLQDPISGDRINEQAVFIRSGKEYSNNFVRVYDLITLENMINAAGERSNDHIDEPYSRCVVTTYSVVSSTELDSLTYIDENKFVEHR